jgi:curved DNA-binding protein CbpA
MEIPLTGNIKDVSLVKLLVFLNRNRKTGTLSLKAPVFTKKIYIHGGDAIFASSTYEDDRLGEMLLKADKITVEQYDKSVEILKRSKKRQGAILVELGYLTPKDLFWGVKYQVKEIIHSMFLVEDAAYEFMEGEIPNQEVITLKMSMGNLIYDGVRKIENWTRIRNEMPDTDSVFRLSADPLSLFQGIELSSQDKKILSLIDGRRTIKEVIENSWMGSFEALKILYVLWSTGIIEQATAIPEEAAAAEHAKEQQKESVTLQDILSPLSEEEEALVKRVNSIYPKLGSLGMYELLDAGADADSNTIKRNYYRLAKEFHPDRYFAMTDESVKSKLTEIFDAVTKAYNVLKDEKSREEYFRSLGGGKRKEAEPAEDVKAEDQFRRGVEEFKKGNFWGAAEHFKWSTKLMPKSAQYWSYLSLAFSKTPGRLKDAEEALLTAVKIEPFNADHYANLGLVYIKAGIRKRACSNFEKALRIDPSNEKAKKGLEQTKE